MMLLMVIMSSLLIFREAVQLQAPIPHMVVGSHIIASVFPDIQVLTGFSLRVSITRHLLLYCRPYLRIEID